MTNAKTMKTEIKEDIVTYIGDSDASQTKESTIFKCHRCRHKLNGEEIAIFIKGRSDGMQDEPYCISCLRKKKNAGIQG